MAIIFTYPKKSNPVDNDLVLISDSEDSNKTKQVTISDIRSATVSGVSQIVAGTNITISPVTGTGVVTINSSGGGGSGTVTSVGLTMPAAFSVANSPVTTSGTLAVTTTGGSAGQYLDYTGAWSTPANTTDITLTTTGTSGAATWDGTTLNIPQYSGSYTLPLATSSVRGGVKIGYTQNARNYPVELSSEQMFVNVPWTDTATSPSAPANAVQFNSGSGFGGSINLTFSTDTLTLSDTLEIKGDGSNPGTLKLYCESVGTPHAVSILGPVHSGATAYEIRLPNAAPSNNQILQSSGSGELSWINTPSDTNTNIGNSDLTLSGVRTLANDIYNLNFTSNNSGVGSLVRFQNYVTSNKLGVRVDHNLRTDGQAWSTLHAKGNVTGNVSIDWDDGNVQEMTLAGNINLTQANCNPGGTYILIIHQDAEALNTITWSTDFDWMNNNTAPGAITAARTDVYTFVCRTATSLLGTYAEDFIT